MNKVDLLEELHQKSSNRIISSDANFLIHEILSKNEVDENDMRRVFVLNILSTKVSLFNLSWANAKYFFHIINHRSVEKVKDFFSAEKDMYDIKRAVDEEDFYALNTRSTIKKFVQNKYAAYWGEIMYGYNPLIYPGILSQAVYKDKRLLIPKDIQRIMMYIDPTDLKRFVQRFPEIRFFWTIFGNNQLFDILRLLKVIQNKFASTRSIKELFSTALEYILSEFYKDKENFNINSKRQDWFLNLQNWSFIDSNEHRSVNASKYTQREKDDSYHNIVEWISNLMLSWKDELDSISNFWKDEFLNIFDMKESNMIQGLILWITKKTNYISKIFDKYKWNHLKLLKNEYFKKKGRIELDESFELKQMWSTVVCLINNTHDYKLICKYLGRWIGWFEFWCAMRYAKKKELQYTLILINRESIRYQRMSDILEYWNAHDFTDEAVIEHEIKHHTNQLIMSELISLRNFELLHSAKKTLKDEIVAQIYGNSALPLACIEDNMINNWSYNRVYNALYTGDNQSFFDTTDYDKYLNSMRVYEEMSEQEETLCKFFINDVYKTRQYKMYEDYVAKTMWIIVALEEEWLHRKKIANILTRRNIDDRNEIKQDYELECELFDKHEREKRLEEFKIAVQKSIESVLLKNPADYKSFENELYSSWNDFKPTDYMLVE